MRRYAVLCTLALLAATMQVQAQCVSESDLSTGILIRYSDGSVETHRRSRPDEVVVEEAQPGGIVARWVLAKGIYHIAYARLKDGRPLENAGYTISYNSSPQGLPVPLAPSVWETTSVMHLPPDPPFRQIEAFKFSEPHVLVASGCTYAVIPIESTTTAQRDVDIVGMLFFPRIGTSLTVELNGETWRHPISLTPVDSN